MTVRATPSPKGGAAWRRISLAALLVLLLGLAAAGCGDSDSGGSGSGGSAGGDGGSSSTAVADARRLVAEFSADPVWRGPATPIEGLDRFRGKLIACIGSNFAVPFIKTMCENSATALKEAGFDTLVMDGKGDPSVYNTNVRQAISQKAAGIILMSTPSNAVAPALRVAAENGIKVITAANDPLGYPQPPEVLDNVTVDYYRVGELQSAYAVANTDGKVNAFALGAPAFPADVAQSRGQKEYLERACPDCKLEQETVLISNFSKTIPPMVQSKIRQDPELNWIMPTFDALSLYVVPSVAQAGAKGRVVSSGHNALPANLEYILNDDVQVMSVGENLNWWGWGAADSIMRLVAGQEPEPENIPVRIIDKGVLEGMGITSPDSPKLDDEDALYGNVDYRGEYRRLWGLN